MSTDFLLDLELELLLVKRRKARKNNTFCTRSLINTIELQGCFEINAGLKIEKIFLNSCLASAPSMHCPS